VLSGGVLSVTGAAVFNTQVGSGAQLVVGDPSTGSGTVVSGGGTYTVSGNGTDYSATVQSGGTILAISGGVLSGATILSGGTALVSSGGTAVGLDVQAGGTEIVASGGALYDVTISGGAVDLLSGAASSGTIDFAGSGGSLIVSGGLPAGDTLAGFSSGGDNIVFADVGFSGTTASFVSGVITVSSGGSSFTVADPSGAGTTFSILNDGGVAELVPCFAAGTRLLSEAGEVAIEDVAVGDVLVTVRANGPASRRVVWTGSRHVDIACHPTPALVRPVRICAGAFGPDLPARDLRVSPLHRIYHQDHLFEALTLVNGATIFQEASCQSVTYHHVELESHDVLLAEGLPAESYLDTGNRACFAGGERVELHPDFTARHWTQSCVPMIFEGPAMQALKVLLLARADALGHRLTAADDLHVLADGARIEPVRLSATRSAFMLPANVADIALRSRSFVPAQCRPASQDGRTLGLCVARLQLDGLDLLLEDDGVSADGWSRFERFAAGAAQRWTTGDTPLPAGTRLIVIDSAGPGHYWATEEAPALALVA